MDDINGVTDDPRDTEIFIAGMSYWTSHADLDTFNSDTLVSDGHVQKSDSKCSDQLSGLNDAKS